MYKKHSFSRFFWLTHVHRDSAVRYLSLAGELPCRDCTRCDYPLLLIHSGCYSTSETQATPRQSRPWYQSSKHEQPSIMCSTDLSAPPCREGYTRNVGTRRLRIRPNDPTILPTELSLFHTDHCCNLQLTYGPLQCFTQLEYSSAVLKQRYLYLGTVV